MAAENTVFTVDFAHRRRDEASGLFTIRKVGDHCGLPGPVIMQLVPRTWTEQGWMYTGEPLRAFFAFAVKRFHLSPLMIRSTR